MTQFRKLEKGMTVYSTLHNRKMIVECVRYLDNGILWLHDYRKTYPHTLKYIK